MPDALRYAGYAAGAAASLAAVLSLKWRLRSKPQPLPVTATSRDVARAGTTTLFFVHGFPDDEHLWDEQVEYYSQRGFRCARITTPNSAKHPGIHAGIRWRAAGYSFEEIADMLRDAIESLGCGPVVLVLHDWGCLFGMYTMKKYPDIAKAVVLLDVAYPELANIGREPTLSNYGLAARFGRTYQYSLALMFWMGRVPGLGWILQKLMPFNLLSAFPYWHVHADHLLHALLRPVGIRWLPAWQTAPVEEFPPCPTLFVWGTAKPDAMTFHNSDFPDQLRSRGDGSAAFSMDAGHYVMTSKEMFPDGPPDIKEKLLKPGNADELHGLMDKFFRDLGFKLS